MRFLALVLALFLSASADAQLFPNAFWNKGYSNSGDCPGGVCPTGNQWFNRDGLSARQHVEQVHGVSTAGMSNADIQRQQNEYHNAHGAGHPVRGTATSRYPSVSSQSSYGSAGGVSYGSTGGVGYGSSGGLSVGMRLSDGSVVTSIGPFYEQVPTLAPQLAGAPTTVSILSTSNSNFRKMLMEAASAARRDGKINLIEYSILSVTSRNPKTLEQMKLYVNEMATEQDGEAPVGAIDWAALIKTLIPLILELIELFKST